MYLFKKICMDGWFRQNCRTRPSEAGSGTKTFASGRPREKMLTWGSSHQWVPDWVALQRESVPLLFGVYSGEDKARVWEGGGRAKPPAEHACRVASSELRKPSRAQNPGQPTGKANTVQTGFWLRGNKVINSFASSRISPQTQQPPQPPLFRKLLEE